MTLVDKKRAENSNWLSFVPTMEWKAREMKTGMSKEGMMHNQESEKGTQE